MRHISERFNPIVLLCVALFLCVCFPHAYAVSAIDDILMNKAPLSIHELERIYQYKLDRGAANISVVSCFLIRASKRLLEEGNTEMARAYAEYAVKLSPDYPSAYINRAVVDWTQNRLNVYRLFEGLYEYLYATLTTFVYVAIPFTKMLFTVIYSLLLTIAVFSFISLYKYAKLLIHDVSHLLPVLLPKHFPLCLSGLILCLPFFFKWSIFLAAFYWLFLLCLYHNRREQQLIILFAWFLVLFPFIFQTLAQLAVTNASETFHYMLQANRDNWDEETTMMLGKWSSEHPYDVDAQFSLALLKKREGCIEEAQRIYMTLVDLEPRNCRFWCNLGNTYLAVKKLDSATSQYRRAVELCPDSVEGYYNLSRAQLLQYMFAESNRSFNKAKQLDGDRVDNFLKIYSENINRQVIDQTLSDAEFWRKALIPSSEKDHMYANLWDYFFAGIAYKYRYLVFGVFLMFVVLLFADRHNYSRSRACEYCGSAVCRKCKQLAADFQHCRQCAAVFKNDNDMLIGVAKKAAQVVSIERFQGRLIFVGKLLSVLIPGSGHLLCGHPFRGTVIVFLFFCLFSKLLVWDSLAVNPWHMMSGSAHLGLIAVAIPLGLVYLYSFMHFNTSTMKLFRFLSLIRVTRKELLVKQ